MKRRTILKSLVAAFAGVSAMRLPLANASDYRGKLFVFVQADGGWDPTSFCDPKANTLGERAINHWAGYDEIRQAGNIRYAPFGRNKAFFEKYYDRMLVINGVDAQTNSHTVGVVHNWSGRNSEGYPTTTALLAAYYAPAAAAPYLSFGGFSVTSGVTRYTRLENPEQLRYIVKPERFLPENDLVDLARYRTDTLSRLTAVSGLLPMDERNRLLYQSAFDAEGLRVFVDALPAEDELEQPEEFEVEESDHQYRSELRRQAQLAVLAFKTGAAVSADLWLGGFDTHTYHDTDQGLLLGNLTGGVDFLWDYAEQQGVADRMVVVMGSDFGRTNFYNADEGKDHWPIGSFVIMEKNQPWTNRAIGETDDLHFAHRINPSTLERDDANGTIIYPKHVHKALRRYLAIENTPGAQRFPFNNTEDFAFFG